MRNVKNYLALILSLLFIFAPVSVYAADDDDSGQVYESSDEDDSDDDSEGSWFSDLIDSIIDTISDFFTGWGDDDDDDYGEESEVNVDMDGYTFISDNEVHAVVYVDDENLTILSYDDVYDEAGNFIFEYTGPGDKDEMESYIADVFGTKLEDESMESLLSRLLEARSDLAAARAAGEDIKTLANLLAEFEIIKGILDEKCTKEGYSWQISENMNFGALYNAQGKTVYSAGDPVIFATGDFIINDIDYSLDCGNFTFDIERYYSSGQAQTGAFMHGIFGQGWTSNLESRLVFGYENALEDAVPEWDSFMEKLQEYNHHIEEYEQEDSECSGILADMRNYLLEKREEYAFIKEHADRSEEVRLSNEKARYGQPSLYVENLGLDRVLYCQDNGGIIVFVRNDDGAFSLTEACRAFPLELFFSGEEYCLSNKLSGEKRWFKKNGLPLRYEFRGGGAIEFFYDSDERLSHIASRSEILLTFSWENRNLKSVRDVKRGLTVNYSYMDSLLTHVTDSEGDTRSFAYDENSMLSRQIKADGSYVSLFYEEIGGKFRTTATRDETGRLEHFSYDTENRKVTYTDYEGREYGYYYDEYSRTVREEKADGRSLSFYYNDMNLLVTKEENGEVTSYSYDGDGNMCERTYPDSSSEVWTYENGLLTSLKDRDGYTVEFFYDKNENLSDLFRGGNHLFHFDYDGKGRLSQKTDSFGNQTIFRYDTMGNLTEKKLYGKGKTSPVKSESWTYTDSGKVKSYTDSLGRKTEYSAENHTHRRKYSHGLEIEDVFSPRKLLLKRSLKDLSTGECRILTFDYDANKECRAIYISGRDSRGNEIEKKLFADLSHEKKHAFEENHAENLSGENLRECLPADKIEYSPAGRILRILKGDDAFIEYEYDQNYGDVSSWREVNGVLSSFGRREFYPDGHLKTSYDRNGVRTDYRYDEMLNLVEIKSPSGAIMRKYDTEGRITEETKCDKDDKIISEKRWIYSDRKITLVSGRKYKVTYCLNAFDEVIAEINGNGNEKIIERDISGRIISESDFYGKKKRFFYDENGRLQKTLFPDSTFREYFYDDGGNCCKAFDSDGLLWENSFDEKGRLSASMMRPFRHEERYTYDKYGRLSSLLVNGSAQKTLDYSADGKVCSITDCRGNKSSFFYDSFGHFLAYENSLGDRMSVEYNVDGTISRLIEMDGKSKSYFYKKNGLAFSMKHSDGGEVSHCYDFSGNLIEAVNENSVLKFDYDSGGRLTGQFNEKDGCRISYEYDGSGNLISLKSDERTIFYTYGKNNEVLSIDEKLIYGSQTRIIQVRFVYDSMGREKLRVFKSGESLQFFYDKSGRSELVLGYDSMMNLVFIDGSVYDESGAKVFSLNSDFSVTAFTYDENGRIATVAYPYSEAKASNMKNLVRDAGLHYSLGAEKNELLSLSSEDYLKLQKLTSLIPLSGGQIQNNQSVLKEKFFYDENGNIIRRITPYGEINYSYDSENRLIFWGHGCSASYDRKGNLRAEKTYRREITYEYNMFDRISSAKGKDFLEGEAFAEINCYDALGRRNSVWSSASGSRNFSYIASSLEIFSDKKISSEKVFNTGTYSGRYVFIGENKQSADRSISASNRGFSEKSQHSFSDGNIIPLYGPSGKLISYFDTNTSSGEKNFIVMTDSCGSLRSSLSEESLSSYYDYDVFGLPLGNYAPFGFCGKKYSPETETYDFGFRNYKAVSGRFTSLDPVCYGSNWYSYCDSNPVDFYDEYGLAPKAAESQYMQDMGHVNLGASKTDYADKEGCLVTVIAQTLSALTGVPIDNSYINSRTELFEDGDISWSSVAENLGISRNTTFSSDANTKSINSAFDNYRSTLESYREPDDSPKKGETTIVDLLNSENRRADAWDYERCKIHQLDDLYQREAEGIVVARTVYTDNYSSLNSCLHFVTVCGSVEFINGRQCVPITPTSKYDSVAELGNNRQSQGWFAYGGKTYIPVTAIQRIDYLTKGQ